MAHCDDSTAGAYVHPLTFTELDSGWTENRAVWNKSAAAVLAQVKELEQVVPDAMKSFHTDNGGEFLNRALPRHLTGRPAKLPWNGLYAKEWSQFTNHLKPPFKRLKREKKNGRTSRGYEQQPKTPYQRLLGSPDLPRRGGRRSRGRSTRGWSPTS